MDGRPGNTLSVHDTFHLHAALTFSISVCLSLSRCLCLAPRPWLSVCLALRLHDFSNLISQILFLFSSNLLSLSIMSSCPSLTLSNSRLLAFLFLYPPDSVCPCQSVCSSMFSCRSFLITRSVAVCRHLYCSCSLQIMGRISHQMKAQALKSLRPLQRVGNGDRAEGFAL